MKWLIPIFAVSCISVVLAADPPAKTESPKTGTLRLLQASAAAGDETVKALTGSTWLNAGLKDILGRGVDEKVTFQKDEKGNIIVEIETQKYHSVNERNAAQANAPRFDESKSNFPCTVEEHVLRYGDQQQTFVLLPHKELVLNALVPLGEAKWYYASRTIYGKAQPGFRDEEMLFNFANDPLRHEQGAGTLQIRSGNDGKIVDKKITFSVERSDKNGRLVNVIADDEHKAHWARILFPPEAEYGRMLDATGNKSKIYQAVKP